MFDPGNDPYLKIFECTLSVQAGNPCYALKIKIYVDYFPEVTNIDGILKGHIIQSNWSYWTRK